MAKMSFHDLREEMRAVARGERMATPLSHHEQDTTTGIISVLTPANRTIMKLIAREQPSSVSMLAELSGRTQSNVSRALQGMARHGLVELVRDGITVRPVLAVAEVEINLAKGTCEVVPFSTAAE